MTTTRHPKINNESWTIFYLLPDWVKMSLHFAIFSKSGGKLYGTVSVKCICRVSTDIHKAFIFLLKTLFRPFKSIATFFLHIDRLTDLPIETMLPEFKK